MSDSLSTTTRNIFARANTDNSFKENDSQPQDVETLPKDDVERASTVSEQDRGVSRIAALYLVFGKGWKIYLLYASIGLIAYVTSLSDNTTYTYEQYAASAFQSHSLIGAMAVAAQISSAVSQPFIARIADLASRPWAITVAVFIYALGFIIMATSSSIGSVAAAQLIYTVGKTSLSIMTTILIADISNMQWRGALMGLFSMPYVINAFVAGQISAGISANTANGWRWGYGMFVIMIPICIAPAVIILFWADRRARQLGVISIARQELPEDEVHIRKRSPAKLAWHYWRISDAFGLLLLAATFALLLLPLALAAGAKCGYRNPSMIAMLVVGGVLLISYFIWEKFFASHPMMPQRMLNRTWICSVVINFVYFLSSLVVLTYWNSYVYVVKDWSLENYTYFTNTLNVALSLFGLCGGLLQRYFHNYKWIQIGGLCIRIIGQGLMLLATRGNRSDAVIVIAQILVGLGGAFSMIASQVAAQASVPHQDLALAVALLVLWTVIGGSIGTAISAAIWTEQLPKNLASYLGDQLNSTQLADIFGDITLVRLSEPRDLVIQAYDDTAYYLALPALILSFVPLIPGLLSSNYYLGKNHNAVEDKEIRLRDEQETHQGLEKLQAEKGLPESK